MKWETVWGIVWLILTFIVGFNVFPSRKPLIHIPLEIFLLIVVWWLILSIHPIISDIYEQLKRRRLFE